MKTSMCGIDCESCVMNSACKGCFDTEGMPFGGKCVTAECIKRGENSLCEFRQKLIDSINSLGIEDMEEVKELHALKGSFINLEYTLPGGQKTKFWDDNKIYLGNQLPKKGSDRCYGIAADEKYLMVCEYGCGGEAPEIVVLRRIE